MIELQMTKRQLVYWLAGLMAGPVLVFSFGILSGAFISAQAVHVAASPVAGDENSVPFASLESTPAPISAAEKARRSAPLYAVQVGSFVHEKNARAATKSLNEKGYRAHMQRVEGGRPESVRYKVMLGRYHSRSDADKAVADYRNNEHLPAFIAVQTPSRGNPLAT